MQIYIDQLSAHINEDRHIALVIDNAGWHTSKQLELPKNITLIPLPPYSPELNPAEHIWEWMKHNYLSNMCFKNYDNIVDELSIAWNAFSNDIERVKSICTRDWLNV
jgi:transposase